ncbi:carboxymuconolactone decarboxylase family protein [Streptomyces mirabilis]|uniref:Alkylhydroperoxidase AhpD family core domain-containing protein n=1 Tax=Streptomyces mirabilis TaxID=68239 RepID=A0A1I2JU85_9ACTN|nr:carboxymuconolactone decarboxylase family protein [Streptomyces mirabilis]SFF58422.1 alkylhydroperoxidase AhpD family core domain-containing protein [Streptomyces mirabilis]
MNRIPPLPYDEWDTEALASLAPGRRLPPSNVLGLFARHPELATAFLGYNRYLLGGGSTLSPRTRELAILRVAWRRRCQYEWVQHVLIARKAGVTEEEIDAIRAGKPTAITRAVDELEADSGLSDDTYRALAAELDDRQLMDLVFTVGTYGLLAMVLNTFEVELDPDLPAENFTTTE